MPEDEKTIIAQSNTIEAQLQAGIIPPFDPRYLDHSLSEGERSLVNDIFRAIDGGGLTQGLLYTTTDPKQVMDADGWLLGIIEYRKPDHDSNTYQNILLLRSNNLEKIRGANFLFENEKAPLTIDDFITEALYGAAFARNRFPGEATDEVIESRMQEFTKRLNFEISDRNTIQRLIGVTAHITKSFSEDLPIHERLFATLLVTKSDDVVSALEHVYKAEPDLVLMTDLMGDALIIASHIDNFRRDHQSTVSTRTRDHIAEYFSHHIREIMLDESVGELVGQTLCQLGVWFPQKEERLPNPEDEEGITPQTDMSLVDIFWRENIRFDDIRELLMNMVFRAQYTGPDLFTLAQNLWKREEIERFEDKIERGELTVSRKLKFWEFIHFEERESTPRVINWIDDIEEKWRELGRRGRSKLIWDERFRESLQLLFGSLHRMRVTDDYSVEIRNRIDAMERRMIPQNKPFFARIIGRNR
ncbi:MAG TPA: hypothetical protein VMR81_04890 [Patescibacteria group bacterium]|nr:hypothetical protein [Patescibacteria group bacterium]